MVTYLEKISKQSRSHWRRILFWPCLGQRQQTCDFSVNHQAFVTMVVFECCRKVSSVSFWCLSHKLPRGFLQSAHEKVIWRLFAKRGWLCQGHQKRCDEKCSSLRVPGWKTRPKDQKSCKRDERDDRQG